MKTWDNLEVGDKVRNCFATRTILAKIQEYYVLTARGTSVSEYNYTADELRDMGYTIVQPEEQEKRWFVNSCGEVRQAGNVHSAKHQKRIAWGNAFATAKDAEKAKWVRQNIYMDHHTGRCNNGACVNCGRESGCENCLGASGYGKIATSYE